MLAENAPNPPTFRKSQQLSKVEKYPRGAIWSCQSPPPRRTRRQFITRLSAHTMATAQNIGQMSGVMVHMESAFRKCCPPVR
jgi:hypothetical protein